jgi:AcrR family transcriptional regulator
METEDRRKAERKSREEAILSAAERLFFSRGYDAVTMDDIAREAGFTKRTLYVYVKSKERLALAISLRGYRILNADIEAALSASGPRGFDQLEAASGAITRFAQERSGYFDVITDYSPRPSDFSSKDELTRSCYEEGERAQSVVVGAIGRGLEDGSIKKGFDPAQAAFFLWSALVGLRKIARLKEAYLSALRPTESDIAPMNLIPLVALMFRP